MNRIAPAGTSSASREAAERLLSGMAEHPFLLDGVLRVGPLPAQVSGLLGAEHHAGEDEHHRGEAAEKASGAHHQPTVKTSTTMTANVTSQMTAV